MKAGIRLYSGLACSDAGDGTDGGFWRIIWMKDFFLRKLSMYHQPSDPNTPELKQLYEEWPSDGCCFANFADNIKDLFGDGDSRSVSFRIPQAPALLGSRPSMVDAASVVGGVLSQIVESVVPAIYQLSFSLLALCHGVCRCRFNLQGPD